MSYIDFFVELTSGRIEVNCAAQTHTVALLFSLALHRVGTSCISEQYSQPHCNVSCLDIVKKHGNTAALGNHKLSENLNLPFLCISFWELLYWP